MTENNEHGVEFGDNVDMTLFEQILEMDDEDDDSHDFSKSIVFGFFEQADSTFEQMDTALEKEDLDELSSLGHFLKGSSATLGLTKVKDECEKIQHYGHKKDEAGNKPIEAPEALKLCKDSITRAKEYYRKAEKPLRQYYARFGDE